MHSIYVHEDKKEVKNHKKDKNPPFCSGKMLSKWTEAIIFAKNA
jgi:hypothetical protein